MAVLDYLGQVPAQWFDASGAAALSGGKLAFYEVGTTTPKAVYSDYQGNTSAGTTVTLDSAGRANIWLSGIYSVQLLTAADVPIGNRIDGIGRELAPAVDASAVLSVETYDDLRALTGANVRVCAVEGRAANGDGGAGLFAWDDSETAVDDGGAILTPGTNPASGRWVRIFSGDMDFRWFGSITGTDDTTAYSLALAASVAHGRWLTIHGGTVRLTSSVSAAPGSMVRVLLGGQIVAASSLVGLGFPAGTLFEGAPDCFGENITVSFGLNAVPAVDVTWWDAATDDAMLAAAGNACSAANMEVLIPRAMSLESSYSQPANAVLNFQGSGKLAWSGAGAVAVILRRWKTDSNEFPRFTFSSVAKLSALTMVESQGKYLSPRMFGGGGTGSGDDAAAVWATFLHSWVWCDAKFPIGSTLTKTGSVYIRGPLENARTIANAAAVPHGLSLGSGVDLDVSGDLVVVGTCIEATNAAQSEILVGGSITLDRFGAFGQDNAGVSSLGIKASGATIARAQLNVCPIHAPPGSIQDSDVRGTSTYNAFAVDHVGLGGSPWAVDRCYIEEAVNFGTSRIVDTEIESMGALSYTDGAEVRDSIITPTDSISTGTAVGNVTIHGGDVSLPLIAEDGFDIVVESFPYSTVMPWNGYGTLTLAGGSETLNNGGISDDNALRRGALVLDGVTGPRSRVAALAGTVFPTSSTASWAFGGGATPTVSTDVFTWSGGIAGAGANTITKTITTDAEKIMAAYGGYIIAEWTGDVESVTCLFGAESIAVATCAGAAGQRAVYHVWPGAFAATTTYEFSIAHGGGAVTLRLTVQPCAPINAAQWETFWGGDRTLSASRLNTWKETLSSGFDCIALNVWFDTLPGNGTYTPRPQTLQPWLTTFTPTVRVFAREQIIGGAINTPIYAVKTVSGAGFTSIVGLSS